MVTAPIGEDVVITCEVCGNNTAANADYAEGKTCPKCAKGKLKSQVAIELGHIFQLGTKYSTAQGALFLDEDGKQQPIIMGCYGIGVSRVIAAIIEKHNDDKGILWPAEVAPFDVELLPILAPGEDRQIGDLTEQYDRELSGLGLEVLVDDRPESPGRKFNDADLIGIPLRVTIGKRNLAQQNVEVKIRETNEVILVGKDALPGKIKELTGRGACTVS